MARIIYPEAYVNQRQLLKDITEKDTADGASSVIRPLLTQQGIVLADDNTAGTNADVQEALRLSLSRQSENFTEVRDIKIENALGHLRGESQFLKSLYKPNVQELGNWGITVNGNRVVIPNDFANRTDVIKAVIAKHLTFAAGTSPMQPYVTQNAVDVAVDDSNTDDAVVNNSKAKDASRDSEEATAQRNLLWLPVTGHMRNIGDYLLNLFKNNSKKLGEWGYTVDDSPRAPKVRITNLKIGETKIINGVTIGGTFTNLGSAALHIYKGRSTSGTPIIVAAGEQLGMTKGFSLITVANPSTLIPGKFSVLRHG